MEAILGHGYSSRRFLLHKQRTLNPFLRERTKVYKAKVSAACQSARPAGYGRIALGRRAAERNALLKNARRAEITGRWLCSSELKPPH
jgi:hypothetical protein